MSETAPLLSGSSAPHHHHHHGHHHHHHHHSRHHHQPQQPSQPQPHPQPEPGHGSNHGILATIVNEIRSLLNNGSQNHQQPQHPPSAPPPPSGNVPDGRRLGNGPPSYNEPYPPPNHHDESHEKRKKPLTVLICQIITTVLFILLVLFGAYLLYEHFHHNHGHEWEPSPRPPHHRRPGHDYDCIEENINRTIRQHETLSSIEGNFPLYDVLDLSTITGTIDITVTPKPGSEPAKLILSTATGDINVQISDAFLSTARDQDLFDRAKSDSKSDDDEEYLCEVATALERTFTTEIHTNTGLITATLLLGNGGTTEITSNTQPLDLQFYAVGMGPDSTHGVTDLRTETTLRGQTVNIEPLQRVGGGEITKLKASHESSGHPDLDITYPSAWRGSVSAELAGPGNIEVHGGGLDVIRDDGWSFGARRGRGEQVVLAVDGPGSIKFRC